MRTRTSASIALALGLVAAAAPARAQDFPPDTEWEPFHCGEVNMFDDVADEPTAVDERDLVGDESQPAGLHAADADYAYLRLRVEEDPLAAADDLQPFAWGFEFDTDGDLTTYEVLVIVSGNDETVTVYTNDTVTIDNSPADPADDQIAVYDFATNGRVVGAGSSFGGDGDSYIDMAVLWDDLEAAGMTPITPVVTWAASSSTDNALDGDVACHDGATGDATLDGTGSDDEPIDPDGDGGGDGDAGPIDPDGPTDLEGGGGCSVSRSAALPWLAIVLVAGIAATRRRRRS